MRRQIATLLGLVATSWLAILWLAAAPLASAGDPCYHDFAMPASTTETATQIKLMPCAFAPTITQVSTGSTVTFFNGPDYTHLITGANQAWGSRDVEVRPGQTVLYTFDKAGVYPYACALHRGMSGTIVVADSTTGAGTAAAAAGGTSAGTAGGAGSARDGTTGATLDGPILAALAAGVGAVAGAAIVFVATRPRRADDEPAAAQTA